MPKKQTWTVILFRNSRADSSYTALVNAESRQDAVSKALDELMEADRKDKLRTQRRSVSLLLAMPGVPEFLDPCLYPARYQTKE